MAQPTAYTRQYDFDALRNAGLGGLFPANLVNVEFDAVKVTIDEILANLAIIQRDDTEIANESIGWDQVKSEILVGLRPPTNWATATAYLQHDTVVQGTAIYRCAVAHTSGTFSTDLAAAKWVLIVDFSDVFTAADILAALLTVDGAGSGLDADLLDGSEASAFLLKAGGTMTGNIVMSAAETVDGRDLSVDGTKLDGIESNATADQSDAEIETAYNNQVSVVSQAEAEAGVATTVRRWTAERVGQAIAALATGSVAGPGSSIDEAIVRFNGTGGDTLQSSPTTMDDNGAIYLPNNVSLYADDNSANTDYTGNHALVSIDGDQDVVWGPHDPHLQNLFRVPYRSNKRYHHVDFAYLDPTNTSVDDVLAAIGMNATQLSGGGTLAINNNGVRGFAQIDTGTAGTSDGYVVEMPNMVMSIGAFEIFDAQWDITASLNRIFEIGLWDGTTDNAIYLRSSEGASPANFSGICSASATATTTSLGVGSASTARWHLRIHNVDDANIEFILSTSGVASGEYITYATISTNIPSGGFYPFFRMRNQTSAVNRVARVDQLSVITAR